MLLADTALSVKEISAAVGYPSPFKLIREFEEREGSTPKRYRARVRHLRISDHANASLEPVEVKR
jgi:AraC-like DNA-binding protein